MRDDEGRCRASHILRRDINGDGALVVDGMRLDDQGHRVVRIDGAENIPRDAGVEELTVLRVDLELLHFPLRHAFQDLRLRCCDIVRTDDEITLDIDRRIHSQLAIESRKLRCSRRIEGTCRRLRAIRLLGFVGCESGKAESCEAEDEE